MTANQHFGKIVISQSQRAPRESDHRILLGAKRVFVLRARDLH